MNKLSGISIVLPCHNERENLRGVVAEAVSAGESSAASHEVIVVCDGSTDGTDAVAESLMRDHPTLRTVIHSDNRGYGAAVWSGMQAARLEFVFFTDADGQFDISELSRLAEIVGSNVGALGYRQNRDDATGRALLGAVYTKLISVALRVHARDMNCAFKLFRRSQIAAVSMRSTGALFNAELLAHLQSRGAEFAEVGVTHRGRRHGRQSGARPDVVLRAILELPLVWWNLLLHEWAGNPGLSVPRRVRSNFTVAKASRRVGGI